MQVCNQIKYEVSVEDWERVDVLHR